MQPSESEQTGLVREPVMAGLRVALIAYGLAYAALQPDGAYRATLFQAFLGCAGYSALLYAVAFKPLGRRSLRAFYLLAAACDLAFVALIIGLTGVGASPFVRGLYVWVSLVAFVFGLRAGAAGAVLALPAFLVLDAQAGWPGGPVSALLQAGSLVVHGPLVGYLSDNVRSRVQLLSKARDELREVNRQLLREQAKLVQAEKLSSIGVLASGVAHEINNPLMGVMGCAKALREGTVPEERRGEYFEAVGDGLERIRATVQGLLDFAHHRPPAKGELDASEVVGDVIRLLQPLSRKKDVAVDNRIAPGALKVLADRTQAMQALVNVMMNAIQAVRNGGHVAIVAASGHEPGLAGIRVEDDGGGMPRDVLAKVCDPFFTTKPEGEGTGLGMAITLGILRAHGGDLTLESEVGVGTKVTLWLPAQERPAAEGTSHA